MFIVLMILSMSATTLSPECFSTNYEGSIGLRTMVSEQLCVFMMKSINNVNKIMRNPNKLPH